MSFRALGSDGILRFYVDDAFRHLVNDLVQHRIKGPMQQEEARKAILGHPFVILNQAACAEERYRRTRVKEASQMLNELARRLGNGEVQQLGLEETTGSPILTANMLRKGHAVRLLNLSDDRLLLSLERHPQGSGPVRVQFWLYDKATRTLRLLNHRETVQEAILVGKPKRYVAGKWEEVDEMEQNDFLQTVKHYLSAKGAKAIQEHFRPQAGYLDPPEEIWAQCKTVTGIDYQAQEVSARDGREQEYRKLQGSHPQEEAARVEWVVDAGIRFGMVPESEKPKQNEEPPKA